MMYYLNSETDLYQLYESKLCNWLYEVRNGYKFNIVRWGFDIGILIYNNTLIHFTTIFKETVQIVSRTSNQIV